MHEFGQFLKKQRLRAGFGLRRFADMIGWKPSNLSNLEHGRRNPPTDADTLMRMAEALCLAEGTPQWEQFFDLASRGDGLPADVRDMAGRPLVPTLLRTVKKLNDDQLAKLIDGAKRGE